MNERLRSRIRGEAGTTLVELVVVVSLLSFVLLVFTSVLGSVQRSFQRQASRTISNDQARLAVEEIDREIRSGNVFYDPASENDAAHGIYPGMALRVYSQTNATTRGGNRCVQWRIQTEQLQRRDWAVNWRDSPSTLVSAWRVVAEGVRNQTVSPQVAVFTLDTSQATFGGRIIKVALLVNDNTTKGRTITIADSVTGRDTQFGYPNNICDDIPAY
jgi:hypothetical protein